MSGAISQRPAVGGFRPAPFRQARGLRRLLFEQLERRLVLNGEWRNPVLPEDVDNSGAVRLADLLLVLEDLRNNGGRHDLEPPQPGAGPPPYLDPDGDAVVTLTDMLAVVASLRDGVGLPPPTIEASLANDDGPDPEDRVTSDARIEGEIASGLHSATRLLARVEPKPWFAVSLDPEGRFSFDPGLAGDGSEDGPHTLRLSANFWRSAFGVHT